MNRGKYVLAQFMDAVRPLELDAAVEKYGGDKGVRSFKCRSQFIALVFGQLTGRESLRDTIMCLEAQNHKLYHVGIRGTVKRSTLADANETRDWRIWQDLAQALIKRAQTNFYIESGNKPKGRVYAIDATTIDLCLSIYKWASFRRTKAVIRVHTVLDVNSNIPVFATITDGKRNEIQELKMLAFERGACYVMDRGYNDFRELFRIDQNGATFVTRAKKGLGIKVVETRSFNPETGVRGDQIVRIGTRYSKEHYPKNSRLVTYFDKEQGRDYRFLTNDLDLLPEEIAALYKRRWMVELFFKWIKQHLKVKSFWGHSDNAVRTQIWIAICTYVMAQLIKTETKSELSLYQILQILSVSVFDKTQLNQLLTKTENMPTDPEFCKQLILFDLSTGH